VQSDGRNLQSIKLQQYKRGEDGKDDGRFMQKRRDSRVGRQKKGDPNVKPARVMHTPSKDEEFG